MVINMNADNNSKALVVYVQPKKNRFSKLRLSLKNFIILISDLFLKRRKLYIALIASFAIFFMLGNCISAYYGNKLYYILSSFLEREAVVAFLAIYIIVYTSGYTIFGRILSVCFFAVFSSFLGNLAYFKLFFVKEESVSVFIFFLCSVVFVLFFSVFCSEALIYYYMNRRSSSLVLSKASLFYTLFSLIIFYILFLLFTLIINLFLVG